MQNSTILVSVLVVVTGVLIGLDKIPAEHLATLAAGVMGWLVKSPRGNQ
jgi:hypothetical protein